MKNNLAKQMKAQIQKVKLETFNAAMAVFMKIMTVVLNEEFGFGKDRLLRLENKFNERFEEFGGMVMEDILYGSKKLDERVKQIMKEDRE